MAVESELMQQHTAAIFVAKGALTVAIFPFLANLIGNSQKLGKTQDIETNWSSPRRVRSTLLSQGSPLSTKVKSNTPGGIVAAPGRLCQANSRVNRVHTGKPDGPATYNLSHHAKSRYRTFGSGENRLA